MNPYTVLHHILLALLGGLVGWLVGCRRKYHMNAGVQVMLFNLDKLGERLAAGVACQGGAATVTNAAALLRSFYKGGRAQ